MRISSEYRRGSGVLRGAGCDIRGGVGSGSGLDHPGFPFLSFGLGSSICAVWASYISSAKVFSRSSGIKVPYHIDTHP